MYISVLKISGEKFFQKFFLPKKKFHKIDSWIQSYDFGIYLQLQRQRCSKLELLFKVEENLFVLNTR
jgi:hypothetical protein